ncbi:hypothetical protein BOO71_0003226 [Deinococcus marmoris]|uniref:Uncharacterized protein n=1 Tax=Deinococcus marmoris TaxID=249408 RepID=A0A1U7P2G8_9DEIO|nr:hypothetical protein BOO71_0003226 [Deinococcus marmoris]
MPAAGGATVSRGGISARYFGTVPQPAEASLSLESDESEM